MSVLLYFSESNNGALEPLRAAVEDSVPKGILQISDCLTDLPEHLRAVRHGARIAILVAQNGEELEELISVDYLFDDILIILVLPDRQKDTLARAYKLYPRFIADVNTDYDLKAVTAILEKMLKRERSINISRKGEK